MNAELKGIFAEAEVNTEKLAKLIAEAPKWPLPIDATVIGFVASAWINARMAELAQQPQDVTLMEKLQSVLKLLSALAVEPDLWKAQNIYFAILQGHYQAMPERAEAIIQNLFAVFHELGRCLRMKI